MATQKALTLFDTSVGKKAALAVSGVILFGFVIGHMLGNLQVFLGREVMNHYAETLHGNPGLLWVARVVLLVSVVLHTWAAIQLTAVKAAARPVAYGHQHLTCLLTSDHDPAASPNPGANASWPFPFRLRG